jgi:penicillin-binding protein 1A
MSPCDSIIDAFHGLGATTLLKHGQNSNNKYIGMVTLKKALANSINTISAKLMDKVGPEAVVKLTHKLGEI